MPIEVVMPKLGLTMASGTIARWIKRPGEAVREGEPLVEVATDKITYEVESPATGTVARAAGNDGDEFACGDVIGLIALAGESDTPRTESLPVSTAPDAALTGSTPGRVVEAPRISAAANGHSTGSGQAVAPAGNGARVIASPAARRLARERGVALAGVRGTGPRGRITLSDVHGSAALRQAQDDKIWARHDNVGAQHDNVGAQHDNVGAQHDNVGAQHDNEGAQHDNVGAQHDTVGGQHDNEGAQHDTVGAQHDNVGAQHDNVGARHDNVGAQRDTVVTLSSSKGAALSALPPQLPAERRAIFRKMTDVAQLPLAQVETVARVDAVKALIARRGDFGWTAFAVYAVARLLREHAELRTDATTGAPFARIDVGVAADTPHGLIVPVVRNAETRSLAEIQREILRLAGLARDGGLGPDDLGGACFSISNVGPQRVERVAPLPDPPQTAILGIGAATQRPAVVAGQLVPAWMLTCVVSFDHRFVDGAPAARFLAAFAHACADPGVLL